MSGRNVTIVYNGSQPLGSPYRDVESKLLKDSKAIVFFQLTEYKRLFRAFLNKNNGDVTRWRISILYREIDQ